ncbi:MAG: isoprenyl transferase [Lachnospiraceae bacterium]|nr:isoprenyl transferase [Lachnospiraceae bacterium]
MLEVPRHVAIILDGNGRWAKKRGLPRNMGHKEGAKVVEQICEDAYDLGIEYLTVYAFSTENWKRPAEEVTGLMTLLRAYLKSWEKKAKKEKLKIKVIGDKTGLDPDIVESINRLEELSKDYDGLHFNIAINYGGRDEIVRAVKKIGLDLASGSMDVCDITEDTISSHLDTKDMPDPELMIRTSGEMRLSNYLLWQLGYAEFYFTDVLWPDFTKKDLIDAIRYYNGVDRRFGGV